MRFCLASMGAFVHLSLGGCAQPTDSTRQSHPLETSDAGTHAPRTEALESTAEVDPSIGGDLGPPDLTTRTSAEFATAEEAKRENSGPRHTAEAWVEKTSAFASRRHPRSPLIAAVVGNVRAFQLDDREPASYEFIADVLRVESPGASQLSPGTSIVVAQYASSCTLTQWCLGKGVTPQEFEYLVYIVPIDTTTNGLPGYRLMRLPGRGIYGWAYSRDHGETFQLAGGPGGVALSELMITTHHEEM